MSAINYLSEDGSGTYGRWHVPDLVPMGRTAELVFVFESPHVDELRTRLPVAGAAGKSALRFLLPDSPKDLSLGRFVQQSHDAGDDRIAILNVSNVPMQAAAFVDVESPDLEKEEWARIEKARKSRARLISSVRSAEARAIFEVLVEGLRRRCSGAATNSDGRLVAAGTFAQRVVTAALPDLTPTPLNVPHPSFNQWNRTVNKNLPDLVDARHRFQAPTIGSSEI